MPIDPWKILEDDPEFAAGMERALADVAAGRVFAWSDIQRWHAIKRGEESSPCPPHDWQWAGDLPYCKGCGRKPLVPGIA